MKFLPIILTAAMAADGAAAASFRQNCGNEPLSAAVASTIAARRARSGGRSIGSPSSPSLYRIRGGGEDEGENGVDTTTNRNRLKTKTINILHQTSFLMVASTSMVVFSPLPSLTRHLGSLPFLSKATSASSPQARAVKILSIISAASAAIELFLSPLVGMLIDSFGRKRPSVLLHALVTCANLGVVVFPGVWSICVSRMVNVLVGSFLVIVGNAVIADLFSSTTDDDNNTIDGGDASKNDMGSVLGRQAACVSLGFLFGSVAGGRLTEYGTERAAYGAALLFSTSATLNVAFRMTDSLKLAANRDAAAFDGAALRRAFVEAPLSSVQLLFHYGSHMRTLASLMLLQSAPIFMGDMFQVFAREEWGLRPKDFANTVAIFGVLGIVSNISLPLILHSFGLRNFSLFAIISSLLFPLATLFTNSFRYVIIAGCLGLFGGTQKVGTSTAMTSLATEQGIPQGQVQGEKASMLALLKISMPLVYGALYLKGKSWSVENLEGGGDIATTGLEMITRKIGRKLPFVLNVVCGIGAFAVTWQNL